MIKKGNQVEIIAGKDKGKKGEVIEILKANFKAKVKGINIITKHTKIRLCLLVDLNTRKYTWYILFVTVNESKEPQT